MSHEGSSVATTEYYMLTGTVIGLAVIYFLTAKFAVSMFEGHLPV